MTGTFSQPTGRTKSAWQERWSVLAYSLTIADPPILSSSPRNGSGTAMNADISLVEQSDSSACPARSLQNVPVRPPIAQSTPSFFCTFLRISQKISISQRLRTGCSLDTEGIGRKSQEKEESRFCTEVAVGEPIGRLRFVLSSCLPLRLTNRWPVPHEPYRQEPFLVDEDRIGGSAIWLSLAILQVPQYAQERVRCHGMHQCALCWHAQHAAWRDATAFAPWCVVVQRAVARLLDHLPTDGVVPGFK